MELNLLTQLMGGFVNHDPPRESTPAMAHFVSIQTPPSWPIPPRPALPPLVADVHSIRESDGGLEEEDKNSDDDDNILSLHGEESTDGLESKNPKMSNIVNRMGDMLQEMDLDDPIPDAWNRADRPCPVLKKGWSAISKCDKIQGPPDGEFDSDALQWYGSTGDFAWIPSDRLSDFVWGENMKENFHTEFNIRKKMEHKVNGSGPLEKSTIWYTCCFGPEDKRHWKHAGVPDKLKSKEGGIFLKKKTITGKSAFVFCVLINCAVLFICERLCLCSWSAFA
ncbi:unnamed protein product [Calypogeia fissa]